MRKQAQLVRFGARCLLLLVSAATAIGPARLAQAQQPEAPSAAKPDSASQDSPTAQPSPADPEPDDNPETMFPHFKDTRFWLSGQANFIFQTHPPFHADYSGKNSLSPNYEKATSRVMTLYTGLRLNNSTELLVDIEEAGGAALSTGLGLAGNTDLDIVRNPLLSKEPYLGRGMIHKVFALSKDKVENQRSWLSLFDELPRRRLEIRFGKFSMPDFFDVNSVGSDTHLQFINWTTDNNGAYDYAADTRGYTVGAMIELEERNWALRFAETLMPKVANGPDLDADVARARAENLELELRPQLFQGKDTTIRLSNYINHGDMGNYEEAVQLYLDHVTPTPDIHATAQQGTIKYGFGVNLEQELWKDSYAFGRWGWNEGKHESFCYTEDNEGVELGVYSRGTNWHRTLDRAGVAFVTSGLSKAHQAYLAYGGLGFLLGDGALDYGRENIEEVFYTAHVWRGAFLGGDIQHINNPGMNRARGPFTVPGIRLHLEF